jgi:predicted nucleic-acid-binding Zn-ribbon protein
MKPITKCPVCGNDTLEPLKHENGSAYVSMTALREDQAKRGHAVLGGAHSFVARVLKCSQCGFVAFFHEGKAPAGGGASVGPGGSIHIGDGGRIESR